MIRKSNVYVKNIYVSLFLLFALYSQAAWLTTNGSYYTVYLSSAIAAGFYVSFGRKVIPSIVFTSLIGVVIIEMIVTGSTFTAAALYSLPVTFLNITAAFCFDGFLRLFKVTDPKTLRDGVLYVSSIVFTVLIVAIFPTLQMSTINQSKFFREYLAFVEPMFTGMIVFSLGIIMSNYYDPYMQIKIDYKTFWNLVFFVFFSVVAFFLFRGSIFEFNFNSFGPIFIVLFIINAFLFNYRLLLANSYMYITIYSIVYFRIIGVSESLQIATLNFYLVILITITIFTKVLVYELRDRNKQLIETKESYEDMLSSTLELLKVRETLSVENVEYQESIMKNIFDIALRIFHNVEHATCVIKGEKHIEVLDTKGYDIELFRQMKLGNKNFKWNNFKPVLKKNVNNMYKDILQERYRLFEKELPIIKESISILIKLNDTDKGAITFDIIEGTNNSFSDGDLYNIGAFQSMINSFYEMNELTIKNNSLRDDIVLSLIRTLELYDQYTGGHSEDVAFLANEISKALKLPLNERYDIYWAGIVHDIGKIGISSDIINKTTKLTLKEYKKVQEHPVFGYEVLSKSEDLKQIAKLVKHHHEWYNGTGYPDRLKEDEIPFGAQVLQVADSVSSMATKRSYQKAKTFEEIIEELEMYRGVQFNPEITDVMIKLINTDKIKNYFKTRKE